MEKKIKDLRIIQHEFQRSKNQYGGFDEADGGT